jgi:hypothetical protein
MRRAARLAGAVRPDAARDVLVESRKPFAVLEHPADAKRTAGQPRVFMGPIASGNVLLKEPVWRDRLRDQYGVKAVEMEGSGIADATWVHGVGYLAVRGICDYCDSNKNDDWHMYAAVVAAAYARALLGRMAGVDEEIAQPKSGLWTPNNPDTPPPLLAPVGDAENQFNGQVASDATSSNDERKVEILRPSTGHVKSSSVQLAVMLLSASIGLLAVLRPQCTGRWWKLDGSATLASTTAASAAPASAAPASAAPASAASASATPAMPMRDKRPPATTSAPLIPNEATGLDLRFRYRGMIRRHDTKRPMVGVVVTALGTPCRSATDGAGHFDFKNCEILELRRSPTVRVSVAGNGFFCSDIVLNGPPHISIVTLNPETCVWNIQD